MAIAGLDFAESGRSPTPCFCSCLQRKTFQDAQSKVNAAIQAAISKYPNMVGLLLQDKLVSIRLVDVSEGPLGFLTLSSDRRSKQLRTREALRRSLYHHSHGGKFAISYQNHRATECCTWGNDGVAVAA
jgi:hypothetical protein